MMSDAELLASRLPAGERVLWHGRPNWKTLALRAFHLRKLAIYFALLLVWYGATVFSSHDTIADAAVSTLRMTGVALVPLALVCLYAWMTSRATIYMITDRRVVMRVGIALPLTINLPFRRIETAGLKIWTGGDGDIPVSLAQAERMTYLVLWPHARPWRMKRPEPMLRCIEDAGQVARILARALAASAEMPVQVAADLSDATGVRPTAPVMV
jgi:hypothetical protein